MDANKRAAQTTQQAVEVLRAQFGERVDGGKDSGMVTMRRAIESGMGLSESQADILITQLAQTHQVIYHAPTDIGDQASEPVVPLPRDNPGDGLLQNVGHGLTTPIAGVMLDNDNIGDSPSLLEVNEQGYWTIADNGDAESYGQLGGPMGVDYDQPADTNSYASDLLNSGLESDGSAREHQ